MCLSNPGTPPWRTANGRGGWGADHNPPLRVARAGDRMVVSWAFAEGGSGIVGIAPDGLKTWGEKRGAYALAGDGKYVYAVTTSWHAKGRLCRMSRKDGSYQRFVLAGKPRAFELSLVDLGVQKAPGEEEGQHRRIVAGGDLGKVEAGGQVTALAVAAGRLVLATSTGKLAVLDAESAGLRKLFRLDGVQDLALARDGRCLGIRGGKVVAHGTIDKVAASKRSITGKYLRGDEEIEVPRRRRPVKGRREGTKERRDEGTKGRDRATKRRSHGATRGDG